MEISYGKLLWWIIKNRVRYPKFKKKCMYHSEPNLIYGLTDHPLDYNATAVFDIFTIIRKFLARKPISILKIKLKEKNRNSFIFQAKGYNIIQNRNLNIDYLEYLTDEKVKFTDCTLQIDVLTETTYRLRLAMKDKVPLHNTPMLCADITYESLKTKFEELDGKYIISTSAIQIHVFKEDFKIQIYDHNGHIITESGSKTHDEFATATDAFPLGFVKNRKPKRMYAVENFNLYPNESIFGLGEKYGALNRVGQNISLWHLEGTGNTTSRAYKHIPFYLSSRGYGVFFNDYNPMTFWIGTKEVSKLQMAVENDIIDYFFFYGPTPKKILKNYSALTGRASIPPRWSFGVWMSRLSYGSQKEVIDLANRIRKEKYPCDIIHIDTNWFTHEWACDWQFDKTRFPNAELMVKTCSDLGFKISLWQCPYVNDSLALSKEGKKEKIFAKNRGPFMFLYFGPHHVIDFSKQKSIEWYQDKITSLFKLGAKIIKADFGEQIEPHQKFMQYSGREMHNLFPLLYNKAVFEATEDHFGKGEALIWARSAYAGSQRYPVHWSGDNSSNFPNMLCSLRGGLSLGLCSFTFWSQDVGGFMGIPDDKLYIRWVELSLFQSHFRFHGCSPKFREPWNYSKETQDIVRKLLELRYQFVPYLYSESIKAAQNGHPLMRTLFFDHSDDPNCYHIEDQYMSGEILLIAPLLTEEDSRQMYIPSGEWYDFWTGESIKGPVWINMENIPIDKIPILVKAGTILPLGEKMQYISDEIPNKLTLLAYPNLDGKMKYELHDELGEILFDGHIEGDIFKVKVSYIPLDRPKLELEIQTPPILNIKQTEII